MSGSENPLSPDESSATEILVERVDESNLPAPFSWGRVIPAHHSPGPVAALHPADVLVGHEVGGRPRVVHSRPLLAGTPSLEWEVWADELQ